MPIPTLAELVAVDEGLKLTPYRDTRGVLTIGYGRNLDEGISKDEAAYLCANDCARALKEAETFYWFQSLDPVRQLVVLDMIYNLGLSKFLEFNGMISALRSGDFPFAAKEMMNSLWAKQVPNRAAKLSNWMSTGSCD